MAVHSEDLIPSSVLIRAEISEATNVPIVSSIPLPLIVSPVRMTGPRVSLIRVRI